jgi:hypothetical protein
MTPLAAASAVFLATLALGPVHAMAEAAPQGGADVAFVEEVTGRVVAHSHGMKKPLEKFVILSERTRLELGPNSELRICHYGVNRVVTLSGPLLAVVSKDGVTAENGRINSEAPAKCAPPATWKKPGGLMMRGKPKVPPPE